MKLVKLTNTVSNRLGDPIYIHPTHVTSVYEDSVDGGSIVTKVHGDGLTWTVEESLKETVKLIEDAMNDV